MSIEDLKSAVTKSGGLAPANRFLVRIGDLEDDFIYFAESVNLPGRNISTTEYTNNRQTLKHAYTFIDSDVTMSFILGNDYKIREQFDTWLEKIIDTENYRLRYKDDYASKDISISQLNQANEIVYTVSLLNAYPINVSDIQLATTSENDVSRMSVTFTYDRFITDSTSSFDVAALSRITGDSLANKAIALGRSILYDNIV